jgi:hypothetical protein
VTTVLIATAEPLRWADLLERLPVLEADKECDLRVDNGQVRVWLSRCGTADGEPFERTVYVESNIGGHWVDVGYFDGDEEDPDPWGIIGIAWTLTKDTIEQQERNA